MRNKILLFTIACCFLSPFSPKAYGEGTTSGVIVYPSFSFVQQTGTLIGNQNVLNLDFRAGYCLSTGWYFGLIFNSISSSGTNTINGSAVGNSVGFFTGIFSVIASYYLSARLTESVPPTLVQRTGGSGFQLDLALNFPIAGEFHIGPMIAYKTMAYSSESSGGTIMNTTQTQSFFYPALGMYFKF